MEIEIRAADRLRGSAGAQAALRPLVEAVCRSDADLATTRVVCDWIQYKANFRDIAMVRAVLGGADGADTSEGHELAVDLRRCAAPGTDVAEEVTAALLDANPDRVWLEPWGPGSASCVWRFNALYWQALADWEKVTGRAYEQTLPGGASDARNAGAARDTILDLFKIWDELASGRALPEQLYVLELGVGNGGQARTWLDEFVELDRRHGRDYYRRLQYLMGDEPGRLPPLPTTVAAGVPVTWALHVCYGNRHARPSWEGHYDFLFPSVLAARVDQLVLEFARKGLADLRLLDEYGWPSSLGLGVIDVKSSDVETPGLVAERIRRALEYIEPARLMINPDCGLRHLAPEVARRKLRAMVSGAALVRSELGHHSSAHDSQLTGDNNG